MRFPVFSVKGNITPMIVLSNNLSTKSRENNENHHTRSNSFLRPQFCYGKRLRINPGSLQGFRGCALGSARRDSGRHSGQTGIDSKMTTPPLKGGSKGAGRKTLCCGCQKIMAAQKKSMRVIVRPGNVALHKQIPIHSVGSRVF